MPKIRILRSQYDSWNGTLEARVLAFQEAVAAHATTIDVPAPAEAEIVERLATIGIENLEILDDPEGPPPPDDRHLSPLAFRRRLSLSERAAMTLAASQQLELGNAILQVLLDDLNSAGEVWLDDPDVREGLMLFVDAGALDEGRLNAILS